jgi:hypothetical protein
MPTAMTKKFTPEIDAKLYDELVAVAEDNGQTKRHVLEQALRFLLRNTHNGDACPHRDDLGDFLFAY